MPRYGKKAQESVEREMHEFKRGTLKSGRSGRKVKSRKQAIAIGLAEARRAGAKVPSKSSGKRRGSKKTASRKTTTRRSTSTAHRKTRTRRSAGRKRTTSRKTRTRRTRRAVASR